MLLMCVDGSFSACPMPRATSTARWLGGGANRTRRAQQGENRSCGVAADARAF